MAKCRGCGARITWAHTPAGKRMPVDEDPSPTGNVALVTFGDKLLAVVLDSQGRAPAESLQPTPGAPLHLAHFATCPRAAAYRGTKR